MGKKATLYLLHIIFVGVTFVVAGLSFASHYAGGIIPDKHWVISILGNSMILLLISDLIFALYWLFKRRIWVLLPVCAMLFNIGFIQATFRFAFDNPDAPSDIKVATYNVHAFGANKKVVSENISAFFYDEGVDVACLQEFVVTDKYNLDSVRKTYGFMPYSAIPRDSVYKSSLAIFSRYPIVDAALIPFGEHTDNSAMWADINVNGRIVRVFNIHLQSTNLFQSKKELVKLKDVVSDEQEAAEAFTTLSQRMQRNAVRRCAQVEMICNILDRYDGDVILCGDFNETPASYAYNMISDRLQDGFLKGGSGFAHTFKNLTNLLRLDYVFISDKMESNRYYSSNQEWSDHKPVICWIQFND